MNRQEKIERITTWVENYRTKHGDIPTPGSKWEASCFAFGEARNLVLRQLVLTTNDSGSWISEIQEGTDEVLDLALDFMGKEDPSLF